MARNFTLCLNMIVKNEGKIIINTLDNLCSKINFDYWVICDTGSTDNTRELILSFFSNKNIKGELYMDEWKDFGHNRTLALEHAYNKTDYLFINDADDIIFGDIILPENIFNYDSYYLKFLDNKIIYDRIQLINNRKKYRYVGILHEYIECLEEHKCSILQGNYKIISGRFGDRSNCSNKYLKDALLLENAYNVAFKNRDPLHMRYSFYCANSYKDCNEIDNAIKWYMNTLTLNNWNQEKYICCLRLYELLEQQKKPEQGIYYLIESYNYDKTRVECIYKLIQYYCIKNQNDIAFIFYLLIQNYYENDYINDNFDSKLFVSFPIYSFFFPYYMIIVCERLKKYDIGLKMYDIIFTKKMIDVDIFWIENLIHNFYFFFNKTDNINFINKWKEYLSLIKIKYLNIDILLIQKYNFLQELFKI